MIFDLHNDFPTAARDCGEYIASVGCDVTVTAAIWTTEFDVKTAAETIRRIAVRLGSDVRTSRCPIAIEDAGCLEYNDEYMSFDFSGCLYCSLTWNYDNGFAGGALDSGVLTDKGKRLVSVLNACGCAVDLAHLNRKSFFDALEVADRPICSHTGFNSHPRSIDDAQIKALTARNGLIGLCAVRAFTGAQSAVGFAEVIDGFVQKYGIDGLSLGTDFCGSADIPLDLADYASFATVNSELIRRGYTQSDIDRIFYKNAMRLLGDTI